MFRRTFFAACAAWFASSSAQAQPLKLRCRACGAAELTSMGNLVTSQKGASRTQVFIDQNWLLVRCDTCGTLRLDRP